MRIVTAAFGDTWDSIAYKYTGDEFNCDTIRQANIRTYPDVIMFEGGEKVEIPDTITREVAVISAPWE